MNKNTTLVEFSDLLSHASSMGINHNEAHKYLVDDEVPPMYEVRKRTYHLDKIKDNAYGWSENSQNIVVNYMESNELDTMTLIN